MTSIYNYDDILDKYYGNNIKDPYRTNTRFNYDPCRTIKKLEESTGPGRYMLNVPGVGLPSYVADPSIRGQKWSGALMKNSTDIESALFNINRPLNKDLTKNFYNNYTPPLATISCPTYNAPWTEQTRTIAPAWIYRECPQWFPQFPIYNPQAHTCIPFLNNTSTRILAKDYFNNQCDIPR